MDRFPYDAEARETMIGRLIEARTAAIENDIRAGRASTIKQIREQLAALGHRTTLSTVRIRTALIMGPEAVGHMAHACVNSLVFLVAEALAEGDLKDAERNRAESADEDRIERATWARAV